MKALVLDASVLAALAPSETTSYLRATGWKAAGQSDHTARFTLDTRAGVVEVALPLVGFRDYPDRMSDLLDTLEKVESRSQLEILYDLQRANFDIVRIAVDGTSVHTGSIGLEDGADLIGATRDLVLAGACAALEKRPLFARRKPQAAMDFLRDARLAAPEPGSFVVVVETPVAPLLTGGAEETPPFSRQATATLSRAVQEAGHAAAATLASGDLAPFAKAVSEGVSANLCDGLARLLEQAEAVRLRFSWARGRPAPGLPSETRLAHATADVFRAASKKFRTEEPRPRFELAGYVVELQSGDTTAGGTAVLNAVVDDRLRRISVPLPPQDYGRAIEAHRNNMPVAVEGDLAREGASLVLQHASGLAQVEDVRVSP